MTYFVGDAVLSVPLYLQHWRDAEDSIPYEIRNFDKDSIPYEIRNFDKGRINTKYLIT